MSSSGLNTNTSAPSKVTGQINSLVGTGEELLGKAIEVVVSGPVSLLSDQLKRLI